MAKKIEFEVKSLFMKLMNLILQVAYTIFCKEAHINCPINFKIDHLRE